MAEALELSSANRIRQLAGMPVEAEPAPKLEEPPAWSEIKASEDYKTLTYPEQVDLARQWGAETKQYASTLPDYTPEQDVEIDDFVNKEAVDVPANVKAAALTAGLVKGSASVMGGIAGGLGGLAVGGPVGAVVGGVGGAIAGGELAEAGLQKFTPKVARSREFAPGYAAAGQYAPEVVMGTVGAKQLVQAGKTLFQELGAKRAAQELGKAVGTSAGVSAAVGSGVRAITGGEVTPGTVTEDALFGALYAGLGSGSRVKGYNFNEFKDLNYKVKDGRATPAEVRDWQQILNEAQRTQATGVERAKRTEVELGGRRVLDKVDLEVGAPKPGQPEVRPYYEQQLQAPSLPETVSTEIQPVRPQERPIRPATVVPQEQLPEAGVRGSVRGTAADTAEMQRRGITTQMQESIVDLNDPVPKTNVFTTESQGINREAIIPDTRGLQGEIVREGPIVTPRTQLPSGERLALPAEGEFRPTRKAEEAAAVIELEKGIEERIRQSPQGAKALGAELEAGKSTIPRPMRGKGGEAGFVTSEALQAPAKIAKNYFTSQGALTQEMADELLANKYNKAGMESAVKASIRDYKNAIKEITGTTQETQEIYSLVQKYLDGEISVRELPPKLQVPVEKYRNDIDENSRNILKEVSTLTKGQSETIEANIGSYMTRPYEKFTNKNWNIGLAETRDRAKFARASDFVRNQILDEAKQEVADAARNNRPPVERLRKINETGIVPKDILMGEMQRIVEEGGLAQGTPREYDFTSYGLSKNLSMLKKRQEIPDEIRYLLGEITDPSIRYAMTMQKLINLRVNNRTLQNLRDQGIKAGLFFDYPAPNTIQFAAEGSKVLEPLNGIYMPKDVASQIMIFDAAANSDAAYRTFAKLNAWIKKAKTVYSIKSQVRNFIFNIPIQIQNGNFSFLSGVGKTVRMIQSDYGFGPDTPAIRSSLRRAIKLGVVNNSKFNEMEALMRDANLDNNSIDNFVERHFSKINPKFAKFGLNAIKGPKLADEFMSYLYRSGDNFHKLQLWGYRTKALMDGKGLSREQAEIEAADYANNAFPTYEKLGRFLKAFRANIFAKNFISWDAERIRNTYHSLKQAIEDIRTPGMEKYGVRAIMGNIIAFTIARSAQLFTIGALGYAKYKVDDLNRLAPRYQKDSTLVPVGLDKENGEVTYIDLSFSDAYDVFNQPINAFLNAENLERGLANAAGSLVGNFVGVSIATDMAVNLIKNQRSDGSQITNPKASLARQISDYTQFAGRVLEPGTVSDMRQLFYAIKGEPDPFFGPKAPVPSLPGVISAFSGFRVQKLNLANELSKKAVAFNSDIAKSTSLLSSELRRRGTPSEADITSGGMEMLKAREESFKDMRQAYKAAVGWGLSVKAATAAMAEGNMSRANIQAVVNGTLPRYRPGKTMMRDIARDVPDDIKRRQEIMQSLLEENK